jgi:hypothetical protein
LQKSRFRPRVGQRFADCKPCRLGGLVQGGDARAAGAGNGKDEGALGIDGLVSKPVGKIVCKPDRLRSEKAMDRPARQPD